MRLLILPLLLFNLGVHAAERYVSADGPASAFAAFARAAQQQQLLVSDEGELRVWIRNYMSGVVRGYVISKRGAVICSMTSSYVDGVVTIGSANCRRSSKGQAARRAAELLPDFSRSQWDCPLEDGSEVYVEHVYDGRRSAARIGNPGFCNDPQSQAVAALLEKLP